MLETIILAILTDAAPVSWREEIKAYAIETQDPRLYARSRTSRPEFACIDELLQRESSWRTRENPHLAVNRSSGAYGIPQSLPAEKMASKGHDWETNPITQMRWFFSYIKQRYGNACAALAHHDQKGWY